VKKLSGGWTDTSLTERGKAQAERTGAALASAVRPGGISAIFSSDLKRASETASALTDGTGVAASLHGELREFNNGIAKDRTIEEARQIELPQTDPIIDWVPFPEAENWRGMADRITGFLDEVMRQDWEKPIVIVSHGDSLVAMVHWWLRLDEEYWPKINFHFDPASISWLTEDGYGARTISRLNDTAHLAGL